MYAYRLIWLALAALAGIFLLGVHPPAGAAPPPAAPPIGATATPTVTALLGLSPTPSATAIIASPTATATSTATTTADPTPACQIGWQVVHQGTDFGVDSVAVVGPDDIWTIAGLQITHWDGTTWSAVPYPTPSVWPNALNSIAAAGTDDVWTVGYHGAGFTAPAWVLHWDGAVWQFVCCTTPSEPAPSGGIVEADSLVQVAAQGNGTARAVGEAIYDYTTPQPLVADCTLGGCGLTTHSNAYLNAISADGVWVVGSDLASASLVEGPYTGAVPNVGALVSVAVVAPNDVWAAGQRGLIRWDGTAWAVVPAPPAGQGWLAVSGKAADDVWAARRDGTLYHWDGSAWTAANLPGISVSGVEMKSTQDGWAWGHAGTAAVILHYNGGLRFADVPTSAPFYPYIAWLACRGYISGYNCGGPNEPCIPPDNLPYFRAGLNVTRGQLLKMVALAAGWSLLNPPNANRTFEDVPSSSPFYLYIETGAGHGIISGYQCGGPNEPCVLPGNRPYFRAGNNITRGQLSKVIALAKGYNIVPPPGTQTFHDVPSSDPFYGYIEAMAAHQIVSGYTCGGPGEPCDPPQRPYFRAGNAATRGQVSKFVTLTYGGP